MRSRLVTAAALAALLGSCGQGAGDNQANAAAAPASNGAAAAPANAAATAASGVQLRADGLALPGGGALAFGAAPDQAIRQLQAALGPPAERIPQTDECSAGMREMVVWPGGLTTFFTADGFVGWAADGRNGAGTGLRTAEGIGPGSPRSEVNAKGLAVAEGPFGWQFEAGGVTGTFDSDRPDDRVAEMWMGQTCAQG